MDIEDHPNYTSEMDREKNKYCYATLTRHPYNPLKILG